MRKLKAWFNKYVLDVLYLWVGLIAALIYLLSGEVGYLIASLIAPITHYYSKKIGRV